MFLFSSVSYYVLLPVFASKFYRCELFLSAFVDEFMFPAAYSVFADVFLSVSSMPFRVFPPVFLLWFCFYVSVLGRSFITFFFIAFLLGLNITMFVCLSRCNYLIKMSEGTHEIERETERHRQTDRQRQADRQRQTDRDRREGVGGGGGEKGETECILDFIMNKTINCVRWIRRKKCFGTETIAKPVKQRLLLQSVLSASFLLSCFVLFYLSSSVIEECCRSLDLKRSRTQKSHQK